MKAQDSITKKMIHSTSVNLIGDPTITIRGALFQVKDSSILVSQSVVLKDYMTMQYSIVKVDITDIQAIKINGRTHTRKGIRIGACSGFAIGALAAIISNHSGSQSGSEWFSAAFATPDWAAGLGGGLIGAAGGALVGGVIGASIKIKIPIYGKMSNYNPKKDELRKYAIKYQ